MERAIDNSAVENHIVDVAQIRDVLQRIGIDDQDVGKLARFDGSQIVELVERLRAPFGRTLNDAHLRYSGFLENLHFFFHGKAGQLAGIGIAADEGLAACCIEHAIKAHHVPIAGHAPFAHRAGVDIGAKPPQFLIGVVHIIGAQGHIGEDLTHDGLLAFPIARITRCFMDEIGHRIDVFLDQDRDQFLCLGFVHLRKAVENVVCVNAVAHHIAVDAARMG